VCFNFSCPGYVMFRGLGKLQCIAVCCIMHCVAVCCGVLQCIAVCSSFRMQCVAVCFNFLRPRYVNERITPRTWMNSVTHINAPILSVRTKRCSPELTLQHTATYCNTATHHNTLQHTATLAVRVVSDVGYSPVIGNGSTGGWFGILGGTHEK